MIVVCVSEDCSEADALCVESESVPVRTGVTMLGIDTDSEGIETVAVPGGGDDNVGSGLTTK